MGTVNYTMLPEHMREGARRYVEHGIVTGRFLRAVLENDLVMALGYADDTNRAAMFEWAGWLYSEIPEAAWGSEENVDAWLGRREQARADGGKDD